MIETMLYITAHPLTAKESFSLAVGEEFLESFKESHPETNIIEIDLFKDLAPSVDADVLKARHKLFEWRQSGSVGEFELLLTESEKEKMKKIDFIVDQFMAADKYVFVSPMWNLTIPHTLLDYLNCLLVPGKTYRYTERGPVGLLEGKKAFHIQAAGGIYSEGPAAQMELGNRYVQTIMNFIGVKDVDRLFVEGMAEMPDKANEIKDKAVKKAREYGVNF